MAEEHILKQIKLLNPKIKNKGDGEIADSSASEEIRYPFQLQNNNNNNQVVINEDDSEVLNLWSQTNFFFEPVDPSKINTVQQHNNLNTQIAEIHKNNNNNNNNNNDNKGNNSNEILQLSERELDRQRYSKLKERIYASKSKHPKENDSNPSVVDKNALNKEDFLDFHGLQQLIDSNNKNKSEFQFDNSILNMSSTNSSLASTSLSNKISLLNAPSNKPNKNKGRKSNNLYTQILNTINNNDVNKINEFKCCL